MKYNEISEIIIGLQNSDLELREKLIQNKTLGVGYNKEMEKLHIQNADILNGIIETIGYPSINKVGLEASNAAWLVIQHAISKPAFMKKCVVLLKNLTKKDKTYSKNFAYLSDRIAVLQNKPQLYGTQFDWDEKGELSPNIFDDLKKVNERRKSIGFNTLEEQTEIMRNQAKTDNQLPPKDFEKRKQKIEDWKKSVGWTK
jgi:hypothetical protein